MRKLLYTVGAVTLGAMAACNGGASKSAQGGDFTLTVPVSTEAEGHIVYLTNYDSDSRVDSAVVTGGMAKFDSHVDTAYIGRLIMDGRRLGMVVVEPGTIAVDSATRRASGTPTNDRLNAYTVAQDSLMKEFAAIRSDENMADSTREAAIEALGKRFDSLNEATMTENAGNPLGLYLFISKAYDLNLAQMDSAITANPTYGNSLRVQKLRKGLVTKEATSPGHKFVDFEIVNDGDTARLSDHVGRGHYTLVDFWASWCGPCIRETETIKRIYNAYPDTTLEVLGVAVWDEPENTRKAIEAHNLPWGQILNTQNVATDAYGIPAIPCIILFDPEGNIVSRDLMGAELEKAVADALAPAKR
ncbi:MAG: AhpC/TSA family protein [Paramuribaculum sp.]